MKIHQTLHGYSEGHILLAGSVTGLTQRDKKKMAVLSDWDEYARRDDDSSYITAYPLPDSRYYVIARTWYADEMERPGCVWTHSLLIDTTELIDFFDFRALFFAFARPKRDSYSGYNQPLQVAGEIEEEHLMPSAYQMPSLAHWLLALLKKEEPLLFAIDQRSAYYQIFLLSLINHLPVGILSSMSLCSGTGRIRKYENELFNLQFVLNNRNNLPKIEVLRPEVEEGIDWCHYVAQSIEKEDLSLPMLLHRFSSDIGEELNAYAAVIMVYMILDRLRNPGDDNIAKFRLTLRILAEAFPESTDGANFKKAMLDISITKYYFGELSYIYEMATTKYWKAFDYDGIDFTVRAKHFFKTNPIREYASMLYELSEGKCENPYSIKLIDYVDIEYNQLQIDYLISEQWSLLCRLAKSNPQVLNNDFWLNVGKSHFSILINIFFQRMPEKYLYWHPLLEKMLDYNVYVDSYQLWVLSNHIPDMVPEILYALNDSKVLNKCWTNFCKRYPKDIVDWLERQCSVSQQIVSLILEAINPESDLVKQSGNNKWRVLLSTQAEESMKLEYAVFLFLLSYRMEKDEMAFSFYRKSFETIYEATEKSQIGYYWGKIGPYCPRPFWGLEWDKCELLRKGFANRVYYENRAISTARDFTSHRRINRKLLKATIKKFESES